MSIGVEVWAEGTTAESSVAGGVIGDEPTTDDEVEEESGPSMIGEFDAAGPEDGAGLVHPTSNAANVPITVAALNLPLHVDGLEKVMIRA